MFSGQNRLLFFSFLVGNAKTCRIILSSLTYGGHYNVRSTVSTRCDEPPSPQVSTSPLRTCLQGGESEVQDLPGGKPTQTHRRALTASGQIFIGQQKPSNLKEGKEEGGGQRRREGRKL